MAPAMPLGTRRTQGPAARVVQTGAPISLWCLFLLLFWIPANRSDRGSAPGGRGGSLLYVN